MTGRREAIWSIIIWRTPVSNLSWSLHGLFGVLVYASSLYGFLTMSVLIPITINRIRMEEKILTEEFGDAYRAYKKATSKLIPFIY